MTPEIWKARLGAEAFNAIVATTIGDATPPDPERLVADVLNMASELGFRAPLGPAKLSVGGTAVMWPGKPPMLTTDGLLAFYATKGWSWFLLRVPVLLAAHRGPLAARLQETFALYESECARLGLPLLPPGADCTLFAGGEDPAIDPVALVEGLNG